MRAKLALAATFFLLALLVGSEFSPVGMSVTAPSASQSAWWNNSYEFRRSVTVVNSGPAPLANQTVLLHLNFTGSDVEDAVAGIRLVNASGTETASVVVGPAYSGIYLRSAYLLFVVSMPANSSSSYYIYYGSTSSGLPAYRESQAASTFSDGVMTASLAVLSPSSTSLQIELGSIDSETTMTRLSYTASSPVSIGPSPIAQEQFANDSGLILAGQPTPGTQVAYQSLQTDGVQLTRIVELGAQNALTVDAVANLGTSTLTGVQLTSVIGLSGLTSSGTSSSSIDQSTGLLYTQNPDAFFGVQPSSVPVSSTLGLTSEVEGEASAGSFSGVSSYTLATSAGLAWGVGDIQPATSASVSLAWAASSALPSLQSSLPGAPMTAVLGSQEVQPVANPAARSLFSASVRLTDLSITSGGLTVPFAVRGGTLVPGASSFNGTYTYTAPASAQQNSRAWTSSTSSTAGATSFASPNYYDFGNGQFVSRLSLHIPVSNGTSTAALFSTGGYAYNGPGSTLQITYRAGYSVLSGNFSAQALFVAADFDTSLRNNFNETILLPVTGSSSIVPANGCSATVGGTAVPANIILTDYLIGDNAWRTLSIPLPQSLPSSGFNVRLRLCVSSAAGFSGDMSLEVGSAGVVISGPASQIFAATFAQAGPAVSISYLPQAAQLGQIGVTANLTTSLLLQANSTIGWQDGSTFAGDVLPPSDFKLNTSAFRNNAVVQPPLFEGVLLYSAVSGYASSWTFESTQGNLTASPGISYLVFPPTFVSAAAPYTVSLKSAQVSVSVVDTNQQGVGGATVIPYSGGVAVPVSATTDRSGATVVQLVPWTYVLNATYQDMGVGATVVQVGASPSASIATDLYNLTLIVRDSRTGPLVGANLNLTIGNFSFQGTTDQHGRYSFEAIAHSLYALTVTYGTQTYFSGVISANANNAVIAVTTTYVPASTQLLIVILVALVPVGILAAYFVSRRLRQSR